MKKMMILGAGVLQVPAILKAKELGYQVIAVDYDINASGFGYADVCLYISTLDEEEVYKQALMYNPDVIITSTSDAPIRTVAYVNQKLGRAADLSYEDALCATNKAYMRQRFEKSGVPIPKFYIVNSFEEYKKAVGKLKDKFIVKPADNAGSRGVELVAKRDVTLIDKVYYSSKEYSRTGTVLVEEFVEGPEVSVESFTVNGETDIIAITDKLTTQPPYFVELGHSEQSQFDEDTKTKIKETARKAIKAINIKDGPSHTEIKITSRGPIVIEIAARLGGDFITSKLVPLATGVDLIDCSIKQAIHEQVDLSRKFDRGAAIRFITADEGTIIDMEGIEEAEKIEGVYEISIYKKIGDTVNGLKSSNDRIGHIIASAEKAREANDICNKASELIIIKTEKRGK